MAVLANERAEGGSWARGYFVAENSNTNRVHASRMNLRSAQAPEGSA
jgi:hypothetical protein